MDKLCRLIGATAVLFVLQACAGSQRSLEQSVPSPALPQAAQPDADAASADPQLQHLLAELQDYPVPDGVNPELFAELKAALAQELSRSGESLAKSASCTAAPETEVVQDGVDFYLEWNYNNYGDYNLDGFAGIADLTPLAQNFRSSSPGGIGVPFPRSSPLHWVDGDGNGEINVVDLVTIGQNFGNMVENYEVLCSPAGLEPPQWTSLGELELSAMQLGAQGYRYRFPLEQEQADGSFKVVPRALRYAQPVNEIGAPDTAPPATTAVSGRVTDLNGQPLAGVNVTLTEPGLASGPAVTTDSGGRFIFSAIPVVGNPWDYLVTARRPGYAEAQQRVSAVAGRTTVRDIRMLPRSRVGSASTARSSSFLASADGLSVALPAGRLVRHDGRPLKDVDVSVNLTFLDPTAPELLACAPGDMTARQLDSSLVRLESFGMAEVFLDDGSGQPANLAPGSSASLVFPIAPDQRDSAPASVGLYSYDMRRGLWIEESTAQKNADGTAYIAEVSHFSYWNLDVPVDQTNIRVDVTQANGQPLMDATVTAAGVGYAGVTQRNTDLQGRAVFAVKQSAQELLSATWNGIELGAPKLVSTPDAFVAAHNAPQTATFSLNASVVDLTFICQSSSGQRLPGAKLLLADAGGLWQRMLDTGPLGQRTAACISGGTLRISASYGSFNLPPQEIIVGSAPQEVVLTIPGATAPPIARFKLTSSSLPLQVAPAALTCDASSSQVEGGSATYSWQVRMGSFVVHEASSSSPLLELTLEQPVRYTIELEVRDSKGQSDKQRGNLCIY